MSIAKSYIDRSRRKREFLEAVRSKLDAFSENEREEVIVDLVGHYNLLDAFTSIQEHTAETVNPTTDKPGRGRYIRTDTKQEAIVAALRKKPGMALEKLAKEVYGKGDEQHVKRVRSLLSRLHDLGKVERSGPNKWQAVA